MPDLKWQDDVPNQLKENFDENLDATKLRYNLQPHK